MLQHASSPNIRVVSLIVTKAIFADGSMTTSPGAPGMLRVALKYSSSSTKLSLRVSTETITFTVPAGMTTLKDPPV